MAQEEQIKAFETMLDKLDTLLEFDEEIAVDSVEELKTKYNEFVEKLYCGFRDCERKRKDNAPSRY